MTQSPSSLPDDAIVIRGGLMNSVDALHKAAWKYRNARVADGLQPEFALSVNCVPGDDVTTLALRANLLNGQIRVSTVGAIRAAGFDVRPSPGSMTGHCQVVLLAGADREPDGIDLYRLQEAFGPPISNPAASAGGC